MATWTVTPADRDAGGDIITSPTAQALASSLADVGAAPIEGTTAPAEPAEQPGRPSGRTIAGAVLGVAVAIGLMIAIGRVAPARPASRPAAPVGAALTTQPTARPSASPTPTPFGAPLGAALVAYFDYRNPESATGLEPGTRVEPVARIGQQWMLLRLADGGEVWVRWQDLPAPALDGLPDRATPAPAPAAVPPQVPAAACDPDTAPFRVPQRVPPYGNVVGTSCIGLDEAAAHAEQLAADLRATAEAGR